MLFSGSSLSDYLQVGIDIRRSALSDEVIANKVLVVAQRCVSTFDFGGKIILAGNGGSAAEAQHIAAEFVNYFKNPRKPLAAVALTVDSSVLTSIANDTDFSKVFSRQVQAIAKEGDLFFAYSTSGASANILQAMQAASELGVFVVGFTGQNGESMSKFSDILIEVPSSDTPHIQEMHTTFGHVISGLVERHYLQEQKTPWRP
jgi:D-sedoheptulose 7-phosphate isomerase